MKRLISVLCVSIVFLCLAGCTHTVDEPCDWCGNSPSVVYKTSDGSDAYVCKECSKVCMYCGKKATKHYENLAGMITFVCDDCYDGVHEVFE